MLSALVHGSGTVVAQIAVESKTNEITKVKPLLEGLHIEGAVVTADALLAQREIARDLVEDKRADYLFTVKDNQPTLRQDISDHFSLEEEAAKRRHGVRKKRRPHAMATLRNVAISLLRLGGASNIAAASRYLGRQVERPLRLLGIE